MPKTPSGGLNRGLIGKRRGDAFEESNTGITFSCESKIDYNDETIPADASAPLLVVGFLRQG
jgi:hypothetical protein